MSSAGVHHTRHSLNHLTDSNPNILHWHYNQFDDHNYKVNGTAHTLFFLFILLSIILFVVLLLLYTRWYFRFRHRHTSVSYYHARRAPSEGSHGLDLSTIKAMPILLHREAIEMECCICLGVFEDGDKVKVLVTCQHRFHSECVDRWLCTQSSCPLCRVSLRVDSPAFESDSALDIV